MPSHNGFAKDDAYAVLGLRADGFIDEFGC